MKESQEENYTSKNFRFRDFRFKARFEIFWIDSDQKQFLDQFFGFVIFSLYWAFWPKKQSPRKKFYTRKFFRRGKKDFFQIQCQVYRNDPRQILYNFDFFVQELQFFQFLMNCPQWWKVRKILSVRWESGKIFSSKFNVKYIEMIPVKFSTTLIFSSVNFKFFHFLMNCPQRWKIKKILSVRLESEKKIFLPNSTSSI